MRKGKIEARIVHQTPKKLPRKKLIHSSNTIHINTARYCRPQQHRTKNEQEK